jgi:ABC-type lipoprotein export system ATPase subunit
MRIELRKVIPLPMVEIDHRESEIWEVESLVFRGGEKILLHAPSGKGKTSLLSMIYGLRKDFLGELWIDDFRIHELGTLQFAGIRKKRLSYVFQGLELFNELTAFENIQLKNRLTKYRSNHEILKLADKFEISRFMDQKASILSFGQKQRVAIIRSLCQPFEFLLADEMFSHMDEGLIQKSMQIIAEELDKQGAGMLFTSLRVYENSMFTRKYRV